jgi:hypothetical protein
MSGQRRHCLNNSMQTLNEMDTTPHDLLQALLTHCLDHVLPTIGALAAKVTPVQCLFACRPRRNIHILMPYVDAMLTGTIVVIGRGTIAEYDQEQLPLLGHLGEQKLCHGIEHRQVVSMRPGVVVELKES